MKKLLFVITAAATTALLSFVPATKKSVTDTYTVTTTTSKIDWIGSKKNGYHPGTFSLKSGSITIDSKKITGGTFVIDMNSVTVNDGAGEKLATHLKAADFFDAAKYPAAVFTIKSATYSSETNLEIEGTLSIKGVDVPLKFPAYVRNVGEKDFFAQAFFTLDARLFLNAKTAPEVPITINLFATK